MTYRLGLTGSIGMGKSTTARLFAEAGCAVWDADAAVHRLYAPGGAAVAPMEAAFPDAIEQGAVSRARLKQIIADDPAALPRIESIVHPLVARDRADFAAAATADILVFDIPLLFETGGARRLDGVIVVTAPAWKQRKRVLARPGMTPGKFRQILRLQMPDAEKRARADHIIHTGVTFTATRAQVRRLVACLGGHRGR